MRWRKTHILYVILWLLSISLVAQRFSKEKNEFRNQAISKLKSVGSESAYKIAFDFQNAWDGKFTSHHQEQIHEIAMEMQKMGYPFYPHFYHYFTYLAYSVEQENLQADQLDAVLKINQQSLGTLSKSEYKEFLFGLNIFFARRYLSFDKTIVVQALDGSYDFKLLGAGKNFDQSEPPPDTAVGIAEPEAMEEENETFEDLVIEDDQGWGGNNSWDGNNLSDDGWGSNDGGWDNSQDSWDSDDSWNSSDSSDDSWGGNFSDDNWGSSSSWDSNSEPVYEAPKAQRQEYIPVIQDYLAIKKSQYIPPPIEGPVTEVVGVNLVITTPNDSLTIKNTNGNFLLKSRNLVASQGSLDWPHINEKFRGAVVQLSNFYLKKDHSDFWTPHAKLQFGALTGSEQVEGLFEYRSMPKPKKGKNVYPIFTSNNADHKVKFTDERLSYTGGIQLRGNKLYGKSVSQERGILKIEDAEGNYILLKSQEFDLGDSLMSMKSGSFTLMHGGDSITHRSVRAKYNLQNQTFKALRNNSTMPFKSSYFDMNIGIDLVTWDMNTDSVSIEIMNGKDLLPATFESEQFFNDIRYQKLSRSLNFHPLNAAVLYAIKYDLEEFYVGELALEYKINENFAKAAGKILSQYDFAEYNSKTGFLRLNPNAFHYYYSSARKFDFDNIMLPSKIKEGANAYIQLDSGKLKVRGVGRFYLTSDFKIFAEPNDSTLTILKGRDIQLDGMVKAGDFRFKGSKYHFDYDEFLFNLVQIDSIQLSVPLKDSTKAEAEAEFETTKIKNELTNTSGILYINAPDNKSGKVKINRYPYFSSDSVFNSVSESIVYFDRPEILDGAYDKSVRFVISPFGIDSIERKDGGSIAFSGTFNSGGIFPTFEETLRIQEDRSLGFKHQIPPQGYNLYGTEAKTYEEIRLSNKGMRGYGQIDFLTSTLYSDDFIYYPDSVTAYGSKGVISPGNYKGVSSPEATLGAFDMSWLPLIDSMYLRTKGEPFKFYNATAELKEGFVNITTDGVFGGGTLLTRGSEAKSNELNFKENEYSARHAVFNVLTDDPTKPAMAGEDIRLNFDLTTNTATINPEKEGKDAITFPYAKIKTSITQAVWDLEDSVVIMTKPVDVPIESTYFYSTREDLDSLVFNGGKAICDINTQELTIEEIPYIIVADVKIIPEGNKTTILANSVLQEFQNAEIIIDTLNGYHYLDRANIQIFSRNSFEGEAYYKQIVGTDTFDIRFKNFELQQVPVGLPDKRDHRKTKLMTVSGGEVMESQNFVISPGFLFKGSVVMYASNPALELNGSVKLMLNDPADEKWVMYRRKDGPDQVQLPINENTIFDNGTRVMAGIHKDIRGNLYHTFIDSKNAPSDYDFFKASGALTFDEALGIYKIGTVSNSPKKIYQGTKMIYNDKTKEIVFKGLANFIDPFNNQAKMKSSILGGGMTDSSAYSVDAMFTLDIGVPVQAMNIMATDLIETIDRMGSPVANDISEIELLYKLANFLDDEAARKFEESMLKDYVSLVSTDESLAAPIFISGVKMKWNERFQAWYNTTKLGISNIYEEDINAKINGFLEIKTDETDADVINLFIQVAPGVWYYLGYTNNQLLLYSSNSEFNETIKSRSKPGEWMVAIGSEGETLSYINEFRRNYLDIKEPYNLMSPTDTNVEDKGLENIQKEDDGFGFEK